MLASYGIIATSILK